MPEFFFNKLAGLSAVTLFKKRLGHRCFPMDFAKLPRTPFLKEHLQWLLLMFVTIYLSIIQNYDGVFFIFLC